MKNPGHYWVSRQEYFSKVDRESEDMNYKDDAVYTILYLVHQIDNHLSSVISMGVP